MKYAFDIDNTLVTTKGSDYENSKPIPHRINSVNQLYEQGHTIILFTGRGSSSGRDYTKFTEEQMKIFGVKYHSLVCGKPDADFFIDDKAMSPTEWDAVSSSILSI